MFGWQAADDNWGYGSIQRELLLRHALNRQLVHSQGSVVAAMNRAATQDLRVAEVLPAIQAVLDGTSAPSARDQQMLDLLASWRTDGSSRLDRDLDGKIDDPGAAIMDKAWPKIADAVMSPVLGPQLGELASLIGRDNPPNNQGSAYGSGWYGYVDKDLRTLVGAPVSGKFKNDYCGADAGADPNARLASCRTALWAAIDAAGNELQAEQGTANPADWRKTPFLSGFSSRRASCPPRCAGPTARRSSR